MLPDELGLLTDMLYLDFELNPGLSGTIPSTIGAMEKLFELWLDYCALYGTIPWSVFNPSLCKSFFVFFDCGFVLGIMLSLSL